MKISYRNNVLALSAESPAEHEICALFRALDGHVFRLHAATDRGMALSPLGPEEDARRAPLNIVYGIDPRFAPISNLAHTPFVLEGKAYASVEGFWQGLKTADVAQRRTIAMLAGPKAKAAGDALGQPAAFDHGGERIIAGTPEHWALMRAACTAKFEQNETARAALLATGERWLTHRMRRDSRTIPGALMAEIWMRIRARLQGESQAG